MTYSSILDAYGWERFAADAQHAGATSLIVADLPADVGPETRRVQLVAPTSTDERLRLAAAATDGWLYLVTVTGTTGARAELAPTLAPLAARARAVDDDAAVRRLRHLDAGARARGRRARRRDRRRLARGRGRRAGRRRAVAASSARSAPHSTAHSLFACAHPSVSPASRPSRWSSTATRRSRSSSAWSPRRRPPSAPSSCSSPRRSCPSIRPTAGCAHLAAGPDTELCSRACSNSRSRSPAPTPSGSRRSRASTACGSRSASTSASAARSTTRCCSSPRTAGSPCTTASSCRRTTSAWSGARGTAAASRPPTPARRSSAA